MASKNTLTVKVKQKHINKGKQDKTNTCAIALALAEQFNLNMKDVKDAVEWDNSRDYISVGSNEIVVRKTNGFSFNFKWSSVPKKVTDFVRKFDANKKSVKPFAFNLPFFK